MAKRRPLASNRAKNRLVSKNQRAKKQPGLRRKLKLFALTGLMIGLNTNTTAAQIDLLDAYTLAITNSPEWAAQREQYAAKLETVPLARSQLMPQVAADAQWSRVDYSGTTVNFNINGEQIERCTQNLIQENALTLGNSLDSLECLFTDETEPFTTTTIGLRMSQPLFRLDRWHQLKRSESLADRASAELEKAKQDLILETATTYFNVLKAKEALKVVKNEQQALTRSLQLIQKRFERGLAKSAQVYETQAQHDVGLAGLLTAETTESDARAALTLLTRTEGVDTTALPKDIPLALPQPEAPAEWARAAKTSSPELGIVRMSAKMAHSEYRAKKALRSPTVDLFVSVTQTDAGGATPILDEGANTNTSVGVSFKVPLFTSGAITANINQAMHQRQALRHQVTKLEYDVSQQVVSQYRRVQLAVNRAKAQSLAVTSTRKAHKAIERGYKAGSHTLSQLFQAQRSVYLARRDAANARYDYVLETLRLKRMVGILGETDLQTLNAWLPAIPAKARMNLGRATSTTPFNSYDNRYNPQNKTVNTPSSAYGTQNGAQRNSPYGSPYGAPTATPRNPAPTGQPSAQPQEKKSGSFADALRNWLGR